MNLLVWLYWKFQVFNPCLRYPRNPYSEKIFKLLIGFRFNQVREQLRCFETAKASGPLWSVKIYISWRYLHYCKLGRPNSIRSLFPLYFSTISLLEKTHMISDLMLKIILIIILSSSKFMTSPSDRDNS